MMAYFSLPDVYVLPTLTKCLAGGTAYFGVMSELLRKRAGDARAGERSAGFLIQTFDLPGIGIYLGIAVRRKPGFSLCHPRRDRWDRGAQHYPYPVILKPNGAFIWRDK